MIITRVRVVRYRVPFREPYVTAAGSATDREGFIVQIETDEGFGGVGESSLLPHETGVDALGVSIQRLCAEAVGNELERYSGAATGQDGPHWAGLSMAAADAFGRSLGRPTARLFESRASSSVAVNGLIGGGDVSMVYDVATRLRRQGFETVKLKVGVADSVKGEAERVAAARIALGPEVKLRLDANGVWSETQAVETLFMLSPYNIEYIEQPVAPGNLDVLRRVRLAAGMAIAIDEDAWSQEAALRAIREKAADIAVLKLIQLGSVATTWLIAEQAWGGFGVVMTTSIDTGIGTAAALQLAAAIGGEHAHGLATLDLLEDDLIVEELPIEEGSMRLPDAPGLGVTLDEAALRKYTVDEWETRA